ncbi:hypothetical protein MMC10_002970 [Thelotrema lepadinum]|nr:hypothetical protein [Thelotrema lepadinum]
MSSEYEGQDPLDIARQAEKDMNSRENRTGQQNEVGVDENIGSKFPGATVTTGSAASGAGDNREIPLEEGGGLDAKGRPTKAKDFEGEGGPETKAQIYADENPGNNDVRSNIRASDGDKSL